jgi:oligoendopeptidase F
MSDILKRSDVELSQTWDLTSIFKNDEEWEKEFKKLSVEIEEILKYENIMVENIDNLKATLKLDEDLSKRMDKLYTYAHLKGDEDSTNSKYQEYNNRALSLYSRWATNATFEELKLLELSEEKLNEYFNDEEISFFKFYISNLLNKKKHKLTQKEEELLANLMEIMAIPHKTFSMLNEADLKFDDVMNSKGEVLPLNHARYISYLESTDRILRENAFRSTYRAYGNFKNSFASTLQGQVLIHTIGAKLKNYPSARNAALSSNFIDESVYDALIEAVNSKLYLLHKYMEIRKNILKLDEMHQYDIHTSLIENVELSFTFEEARDIILDALSVMGEEYISILKKAFDERWIDYAENVGKRSGAYSGGTYGTNPFILISWRGTIDNLFTLAHELGHSLHSYYTRNNQPYLYGHYTIFLAEVASITNELLLSNYLMKKYSNDDKIKAYIVNHDLDKIKSTLYRQTQFAEFEYEIHKIVENGGALTADTLSDTYYDINKKYYGEYITYDDEIRYEWARIPHFYYNFYVYQYATGISAASAFAKKILNEGKPAVEKYINYLKSGSSDYSLEILKKAGVDMSTNKPVLNCLDIFEEQLKEFEKLVK